jgi:putative ABC transport system permease protein
MRSASALALGAERWRVIRMILGRTAAMVAVGLLLGLLAAMGVSRVVASQLCGVTPMHWISFAVSVSALVFVAAIAGFVPAYGAA